MILIEIAPSKEPQRSSFEATTIDGFIAQGCESHRNRSFEAAAAQLLRGNHSATPQKQPQSMDSLHRAVILIEIAPSRQPLRNSFEAATIDGFSAQDSDSHRSRSFEAISIEQLP